MFEYIIYYIVLAVLLYLDRIIISTHRGTITTLILLWALIILTSEFIELCLD